MELVKLIKLLLKGMHTTVNIGKYFFDHVPILCFSPLLFNFALKYGM
jgi:hypothetical protein